MHKHTDSTATIVKQGLFNNKIVTGHAVVINQDTAITCAHCVHPLINNDQTIAQSYIEYKNMKLPIKFIKCADNKDEMTDFAIIKFRKSPMINNEDTSLYDQHRGWVNYFNWDQSKITKALDNKNMHKHFSYWDIYFMLKKACGNYTGINTLFNKYNDMCEYVHSKLQQSKYYCGDTCLTLDVAINDVNQSPMIAHCDGTNALLPGTSGSGLYSEDGKLIALIAGIRWNHGNILLNIGRKLFFSLKNLRNLGIALPTKLFAQKNDVYYFIPIAYHKQFIDQHLTSIKATPIPQANLEEVS